MVGYDKSEEKEAKKDKEWLKDEVTRITNEYANENYFANYTRYMISDIKDAINQLDKPEPQNITLQDITDRLWGLSLNNRKHWLEKLNGEFQEGYIVPLDLKTTDGKEQYLTFNGSYFASRRNRSLQQTFATLEEIPEFYRDLAERVL